MGVNELEAIAVQKAQVAVKLDQEGKRDEAIEKYEEVIQLFTRIYQMVDNDAIRKAYLELVNRYKKRVEELKSATPITVSIQREQASITDLMVKRKESVKWIDVIGLEEAKRAIRLAIVLPFKRPDIFPLGWNRNLLLFGPPGCGKTYMAAAVATEIDADFYEVRLSEVHSHLLGDSEKNVARIFTAAREAAKRGRPTILFLDEVDYLIGMGEIEVGGERRVKNQILLEMDGFQDKSGERLFLYIIAATNKPWEMDEPFVRRFDKRVYVGPPDLDSRASIFSLYTKNMNLAQDVDFYWLAQETEGYSADDIFKIVREVQEALVEELFDKYGGRGEPRAATSRTLQTEKERLPFSLSIHRVCLLGRLRASWLPLEQAGTPSQFSPLPVLEPAIVFPLPLLSPVPLSPICLVPLAPL